MADDTAGVIKRPVRYVKSAGVICDANQRIICEFNNEHLTGFEEWQCADWIVSALNRDDGWKLALQSLTPQGSEFTEIEECLAYVRRRLDEGHEAKKNLVRLRRDDGWVAVRTLDDMPEEDGEYWFTWDDGEVQLNTLDRRHLTQEGFEKVWKGVVAWQRQIIPPPYDEGTGGENND